MPRSTDVVTHDVAFGHDSTPPTRPRTGAGLRVGIGVMAYGGWRGEISGDRFNRYINALAQVVDHVVGRGDTVVLLKGQPVDDAAIEVLLGELSATTRAGIECPSTSTYDELLSAVGTTDVVLADPLSQPRRRSRQRTPGRLPWVRAEERSPVSAVAPARPGPEHLDGRSLLGHQANR